MPNPQPTRPVRSPTGGGAVLPLQGVTILLVEDSRYVSDGLRLLAQRSGARLRRADSLADADRHLALYLPDLVIVDMGLPDGSGESLILHLSRSGQVPVLGLSGDPDQRPVAFAHGANGFIDKPVPGLAAFQRLIADHVPGLGALRPMADPTLPLVADPLALREDLGEAARRLALGPDTAEKMYLSRFLRGLARSADDPVLAKAAMSLPQANGATLDQIRGLLSLRIGQQPRAFL